MGGDMSTCCGCGKNPVLVQVTADSVHASQKATQFSNRESDTDVASTVQDEKPATVGRARRAGIAAASVDKKTLDEYKAPIYEKDSATRAMLEEVIQKNEKMQVLFGHIKDAARANVIDAFFSKKVSQGEDIIRQGEEGDCLYVVASGSVDVFVARANTQGDRGSKVVTLGKGALFGELALMYSAPRAATVVAASPDVQLWALAQEPFKMLLVQSSQQQYALYEGWLRQVEIFKTLNQFELSKLSDMLDTELFCEGEVIINQGEVGDKFYLLEEGECTAFISGPSGEQQVMVYSQQGRYFGELALLNEEPRKATVRATNGDCVVASLQKEDFIGTLGPIKEILMKNAATYEKFAEHFK